MSRGRSRASAGGRGRAGRGLRPEARSGARQPDVQRCRERLRRRREPGRESEDTSAAENGRGRWGRTGPSPCGKERTSVGTSMARQRELRAAMSASEQRRSESSAGAPRRATARRAVAETSRAGRIEREGEEDRAGVCEMNIIEEDGLSADARVRAWRGQGGRRGAAMRTGRERVMERW